MKCPGCGHDLGEGMLPARCPGCGQNLANATDAPGVEEGARRARESRKSAHGLSGFGTQASSRARKGMVPRFLLALALLAAFVAGVVFMAYNLQLWGGSNPPDVTGWQVDRATGELEGKGFAVEVKQELSDDAEGFVLSQDPGSDSRVASGSTVAIYVSQARRMPDVVGREKDDAVASVEQIGVRAKCEERPDDGDTGLVLSASAEKDAVLTSKDAVTLYVSRKRVVPDVVGKTREEAERAVSAEGLKVKLAYADGNGKKEGAVLSVSPEKGTELKKGDTVTVTVAQDYAKRIEQRAKKIVNVVYGTDPGSDGASIGSALRGYLADSLSGDSSSDADLYKRLVRGDVKLADGVPAKLAYLPRSVEGVESCKGSSDGTVTVTVRVKWDWSALGSGYEGATSTDTHTVTMTFDKSCKLTGFSDPAGAIPAHKVS